MSERAPTRLRITRRIRRKIHFQIRPIGVAVNEHRVSRVRHRDLVGCLRRVHEDDYAPGRVRSQLVFMVG